jgi:hypothetical protein
MDEVGLVKISTLKGELSPGHLRHDLDPDLVSEELNL